MALMSYQGHFKDGRFYTDENKNINIPENAEVIITFVKKRKTKRRIEKNSFEEKSLEERLKAVDEFIEMVKSSDEELGPEFDEELKHKFNITRETS